MWLAGWPAKGGCLVCQAGQPSLPGPNFFHASTSRWVNHPSQNRLVFHQIGCHFLFTHLAAIQWSWESAPHDGWVIRLQGNAGYSFTPPEWGTSPYWSPPPPCKQALVEVFTLQTAKENDPVTISGWQWCKMSVKRQFFFLIPNKVDSCFWENFVVFFYCVCPLCNRSEIGDEFHYLLKCTHSSLSHIRGIFLESLYSINSNFTNMSCKALFLYIMSMCDQNILNLSASYIENILILMHPNSNWTLLPYE